MDDTTSEQPPIAGAAAVVVRSEHVPAIIAGAISAASLGELDRACPTCEGDGVAPVLVVPGLAIDHQSVFNAIALHRARRLWPCRDCKGTGQVVLPDGPADLILIADGQAWGTLHRVRYLPVYEGLAGSPHIAHIAVSPSEPRLWLQQAVPKGEVERLSDVIEITNTAWPCGPWEEGDIAITWDSFTPRLRLPEREPSGDLMADLMWSITRNRRCPITLSDTPTALGPTTIALGETA